ncbi:putative 2-dehydropantoate 2-reductase [Leptolyngbya sp. AN02str]|uniref:putative 2-dehydropantoate 2-reductase n=1 Tax=Leptolyngbya sp. AN02str TaxID=3423363 RepID=UPI003D324613
MTTLESAAPLRYAIIGTGALGGFYGARLQQAGLEVHYLLRSDYEHVRQHGLIIESPDGNFRLPSVYAHHTPETMPKCDVVVIALKTTQNHVLPKLLPALMDAQNTVLVLQNGLQVEDEVAAIVGADCVIGGLCFLCSNKVGPGHIHHLDYKKITMGVYGANGQPIGITPRLRHIAADFEQAGIPIELSDDLVLARWKKLIWNIPFNGLSVVLNATTDQMMTHGDTYHLAEELMQEVALGAKTQSRHIPPSFLDDMLEHTANMKPYRTSMKIDYDERRPLEVETMYGNPLRVAAQGGVALPKIAMLYHQLRFLDARNRGVAPISPA